MLFGLPDALIKYTIEFLSEYSLRCLDNAITNRELRKTWLKFLQTYDCCMYRYVSMDILNDIILSDLYSYTFLSQYSTIYVDINTIIIISLPLKILNSFVGHKSVRITKYNMLTKCLEEGKIIDSIMCIYNTLYYIYVDLNNNLCYLDFKTFNIYIIQVPDIIPLNQEFNIVLHTIPYMIIIKIIHGEIFNYDFINNKVYQYPLIEYMGKEFNIYSNKVISILPNNVSNVHISYCYVDNILYSLTYNTTNNDLIIKNHNNDNVYYGSNIQFKRKLTIKIINKIEITQIDNNIFDVLVSIHGILGSMNVLVKMENGKIIPINLNINKLDKLSLTINNPTNKLIFYKSDNIEGRYFTHIYMLNIFKNTFKHICTSKLADKYHYIIDVFNVGDNLYCLSITSRQICILTYKK